MAASPEPRLPLSRDRILASALELADAHGIESLTMRKLGQSLGFEAMSLYNYVSGKDDVLGGILDLVLAESESPSPEGSWDEAVRASAISVHDALTRHPWASTLLMEPGRTRTRSLQYMDALLGRLREAGFSAETTYHAYHVLDAHIFGFSLWEKGHTYTADQASNLKAMFEETVAAGAFPYLHEHGQQHFVEGPHREQSAFEFGLDLILDGLKKLRER
jgi:AcrR family transcriptional regulator